MPADLDAPLSQNRSFTGFLGAQFLGAFNDNLFKQIVLLLAAGTLFPGEDNQGPAFAVFAAPFVLLGGLAGEVSERFSKSRIMVLMKLLEIGILALGMGALALMSWPAMLGVLFLMGTHSAFFGPCKYGGLPEMVGPSRLLTANSLVAMTTFLAVLLGGALPGPLLDRLTGQVWLVGLPCVVFAVIGTFFALRIAPLAPQRPDLKISLNPFAGLLTTLGTLRERPALLAVVIGMSLFWFNGGVLNQAVNGMAAPGWLNIADDEKSRISLLLMAQAVSMIVGSLVAAPLARRFAPSRVVMTGAVGMVASQCALLAVGDLLTPETGAYGYALACLLGTGLFGAIFFVPVNAWLQTAIEAGGRGRAFAANNFLNFLFIFFAGVWYLGLRGQAQLSPTLCTAAAGLVMLAYLVKAYRHLKTIEFARGS